MYANGSLRRVTSGNLEWMLLGLVGPCTENNLAHSSNNSLVIADGSVAVSIDIFGLE